MRGVRLLRLAAIVAALSLSGLSAFAQITTGIVNGTIKDAQGGVIPGATVTLVSETRATRTTPVVSNAEGDFVFPSVAADTYTIEVTMTGFKTLNRAGIVVGSGNRVGRGTLTIDVGGASEVITGRAHPPRSFREPRYTLPALGS